MLQLELCKTGYKTIATDVSNKRIVEYINWYVCCYETHYY